MMATEAQKKASKRYHGKLDVITIKVKKDIGESIRKSAEEMGMNITSYMLYKAFYSNIHLDEVDEKHMTECAERYDNFNGFYEDYCCDELFDKWHVSDSDDPTVPEIYSVEDELERIWNMAH